MEKKIALETNPLLASVRGAILTSLTLVQTMQIKKVWAQVKR